MKLRTWRIVNEALSGIGIVLIFIGVWQSMNTLYVGGFLVTLAGVLIALFKCRCPRCGKMIRGHHPLDLPRCPYCGGKID